MNFRHNPLFLTFYIPSMILAFAQGMLIPVLPLYILDFDTSLWLLGIVLSGLPLGMICGDLPAGKLLKNYGQKRIMQAGFIGFFFANVAMYFSGSSNEVLIYQFFAGFSVACIGVSRHAYVSEQSQTFKRGRAIAMFGGLNRFGRFIGPIFGGSLGALYGLSIVFLCAGGACLAAFLIVTYYMPAKDQVKGAEMSKQPVSSIVEVIKSHRKILLTAGVGQLLAQTIRQARPVIIPLFGSQVLGLGVAEIGIIVGAAAAFDMSLFYVAGWLMDTWGRKYAIIPSFSIQAVAFTLIPFCNGFFGLLIVSCLIGFGNGLGSGNMMTMGADLAPSESRGEFLGLWRLIGDSGNLTAPLLVSNIGQILTLQASALAAAGVGCVAVLFFVFLIPETLVKK